MSEQDLDRELAGDQSRDFIWPKLEDLEPRCPVPGRRPRPRRPREPTHDQVLLERQKFAGEEDQSVPGWDQGA